jgi:undecaprenyl-diphosphatase
MMNFLTNILPSLSHLGIWGYWIVLLAALLESLVLVGVVVPGAVLVVFAGFLSSQGYLDIGDLIWFAAIGAILGDSISYYLGTKGTRFFHNENKWLKADHLEGGKQFFHKHGSRSIFLARFVGPLRAIVPFVAGISGMKKRQFLFWNIISAFLWSASHLLVGYFFGNAFTAIEVWSTRVGYLIGTIFVFFVLIYIIRFITVKHGRQIAEFIRSVLSSIGNAISSNPDVQKLVKRFPILFSFIKTRTDRKSFSGLPLTLILIGFVYVLSLFLGIMQDVLASEAIVSADLRIANLLAYFRSPELTKVFLWITLLGKWQIIIGSAIIVSIILWLWKKRDYILYLWLALAADEIFNYLGKLLVHRNRPVNPVYLENSFSFPSGHAMVAVIFYGFLAYIFIRHVKNWKHKVNIFFGSLVIVITIGFSRLYLGVHFVSDVWGGYLLGFLILMTAIVLYEWRQWRKRSVEHEYVAITKNIKLSTAGLVLVSVTFYVGFAFQYQPPITIPAQAVIQSVDGDVSTYFSEHKIPKYSETLIGNPQEPLGFIFLAKDDNALTQGFEKAGWSSADRVSIKSVAKIAEAAILRRQYLNAPMTPSFWNAAVNDFGFEKPTQANSVDERHHIRIWKTDLTKDGLSVYVATASLDTAIKWFITHRISPDIDTEKSFVKDSLRSANVIEPVQEIPFVDPVLGQNFSSDAFFTAGKAYIVILRSL